MPFAPLLRSRAIAPAAATFTAAAIALYPKTTLHAEERITSIESAAAAAARRKPIYDDDDEVIVAAPTFTSAPTTTITRPERPTRSSGQTPTDRLAAQIGKTRMFLYAHVAAAENKINNTMTKALDLENSFTSTIASLAPPKESGERLMPGSIYVLVSAMTGSIITRNRNIFLRASVPAAIGVAAGWVVLPITMRNVSDLLWKHEQKFPVVADAHLRTRSGIERAIYMARVHSEQAKHIVDEKVGAGREAVEGWVAKGK